MDSVFCIDIDGTITAEREMRQFVQVCNERLKLGIETERLNTLGYHDLLAQPELIAHREIVGEAWFKDEWAWIDLDPRVLRSLFPASGAVEGIKRLTECGDVTFYTARYVADLPDESAAMAQATRQWLQEQQFPRADHIVFCEGPKDKLVTLVKSLRREVQPTVLIDDRYLRLLEVFNELDQEAQDILRRHVTLVAFGAEAQPEECYGLRVIPFFSWRYLDRLIVLLTEIQAQ